MHFRTAAAYLTMAVSASAATNPKPAEATAQPTSAPGESARTVQYHAQDIVPIHAKLKYTTLIVVPPTEKIMEAATGIRTSGSLMSSATSVSSTRQSRESAPI